jgi:hypothetical protein
MRSLFLKVASGQWSEKNLGKKVGWHGIPAQAGKLVPPGNLVILSQAKALVFICIYFHT